MQIAISDITGRVSLFCDHLGITEDGSIKFYVINGAWYGKFKDNTVYVDVDPKASYPGFLVWADRSEMTCNYNEAIEYIRNTIDSPEYEMMSLESIYSHEAPKAKEFDKWDDEIPF